MTLYEEFEKAFDKYIYHCGDEYGTYFCVARWAAEWMADYIAHGKNVIEQAPCPENQIGCCVYHTQVVVKNYSSDEIRQLAKELQGE